MAYYTVELTGPKAMPVFKPVLRLMSVSLLGFSLSRVWLRRERHSAPGWPAGPG